MVGEIATGYPGYDSYIPRDKATIGRILQSNGYATSWFGKDHNTPFYEATQAGPFTQWPIGMGFEYFYGFIGGDASQWQPNLFQNTTAIYPFLNNPKWNLTTAMADEAIGYMQRLKEVAPGKPWLVYYVPGGTHAPHHPTPEWIKKVSAMHLFDEGWNKLRDTIFANQKRLGIMPDNAKLTEWPSTLPTWDSLSAEKKKLFIRQMDVYGAYLAYTDFEIGRVVQEVQDLGELDNTLIIYISGDNGASAEGMLDGTPNEFTTFNGVAVPIKAQYLFYPFWGSDKTFPHYAAEWAWAMDTPFKWVKQVPSHFGGTAQGMAMSWPGHITDVGGIRRQFHHVVDIVPTILEATGIPAPDTVDGIKQAPIEGVSMAYTWDKANANAPSRRTTQYFEMLGNRAIYHDGWVAATTPATLPWELSSAHAAGPAHRLPLGALQRLRGSDRVQRPGRPDAGEAQGAAGHVLRGGGASTTCFPLDNSTLSRWNAPRPNLTGGRTEFTYVGGLTGVPNSGAPNILNKSYTITAEVTIPSGGAEGMIVTDGGRFGGYGLFLTPELPLVAGEPAGPERGAGVAGGRAADPPDWRLGGHHGAGGASGAWSSGSVRSGWWRWWPLGSSASAAASRSSSTTCSTSSGRSGPGHPSAPASTPSSSTGSRRNRAWARAAPASCPWTARKWPGIPWKTACRSPSRRTRASTSARTPAPAWRWRGTATIRRSRSPARSTS